MLNDPAEAKDLEQRDGISRSEIEQFVKKYEKPKSAPAGPGREIKVKPGEQTPVKPSPNLPGLDPNSRFSTKTRTDRGSMPQDDVQNNSRTFASSRRRNCAASTKDSRTGSHKVDGPQDVRPPKRARKSGK